MEPNPSGATFNSSYGTFKRPLDKPLTRFTGCRYLLWSPKHDGWIGIDEYLYALYKKSGGKPSRLFGRKAMELEKPLVVKDKPFSEWYRNHGYKRVELWKASK